MYINICKPKWFTCILILLFISFTNASHFRYGTLTWQTSPGDPYLYQFSLKIAFRASFDSFVGAKVGNSITYNYISYYDTLDDFKAGKAPIEKLQTNFIINNIDTSKDWLTAEMIFTKKFSPTRKTIYVTYYDEARIQTLINNAEGFWNVGTFITIRPEGGRSPKTGILPVMTSYVNTAASWQIPLIDISEPGVSYTYQFTDSIEMPGTQPKGMSISSNNILFTAPQAGLFSAQFKINKFINGQFYTSIVADFLVNAINKPSGSPPVFISPTPARGTTVDFIATQANSIQIVGQSPQTTSTVIISIGNVPEGMTVTAQTNTANTGKITLNWTPTRDLIGVYVVALGLVDNKGLQLDYGLHTFYINVKPPICNNNGQMTDGACVCNLGWAGKNCTECAPGYYGPTCKQLPTCVHGTSNGGLYGDGTCVCDKDWYGFTCNFSLSQTCDPNRKNSIITTSTSLGNLMYPSSALLYLVKGLTTPVTVRAALPPTTQLPVDIFTVFDNSLDSGIDFLGIRMADYKEFIGSFKFFEDNCGFENVKFGFGYFSDSKGGNSVVQIRSQLKSSVASLVSNIGVAEADARANYNIQALIDVLPQIQWTATGSVRMLILATDNDENPTDSNLIPTLKARLLQYNVLLGVFSYYTVNSYKWITPDIGRYVVWDYTWFSSKWGNQMRTAIVQPLAVPQPMVKSGDVSFISSGPTSVSTNPPIYDTSYLFPNSYTETRTPSVTLSVKGFGSQTITMLFNHPPTTSNTKFTINENANNTFDIKSSDPDGNSLLITLNTVPTRGTIYVAGVKALQGIAYPLPSTPNSLLYVPNPYVFGTDQATYTLSDGCLSVNGVIDVIINEINYQPMCTDLIITGDQFTSKQFGIISSDPDGDVVTLSFQSLVKVGSIGTLSVSGGSDVTENTQYPSTTQFTFTPFPTALTTNVSLPVIISDSKLKGQCQLNINLVRINVPPTVNINTQLVMRPDTKLNIPFSVSDPDPDEILEIRLTAINPLNGQFFDSKNQLIQSAPYLLDTITMLSASIGTNISYQAINANENGISFTVEVTDKGGLKDNKTVTIVVDGDVSPYPPVATPVNTITTNQNTISAPFNLTGTHPLQPAYKGNFNIFINTPPQSGSLLQSDGTPLSSMLAPLSIAYKPNSEKFFGNDQFSFSVIDDKNLQSDPIIVQIIVEKVDYPPVIQLNPSSILTHLSCSETIKSIPISILVDNINVMNNLQVNIIKLPGLGSITYDGQTIEQVPTLIDNTKGIQYTPVLNSFQAYAVDYEIEACDVKCSNVSGTINYQFIPSGPTGEANTNIETIQNQPVDFILTGDDCQYPDTIRFQFSSLPTSGLLYDSQDNIINSTDIEFNSTVFKYVPFLDVSDYTKNSGLEPLETFSYFVVNDFSMNSPSYPIKISVHPIPTFTGERNLTTLENTELKIPIRVNVPDGRDFTMNVISFTGKGKLYYENRTHSKIEIPSTGLSFNEIIYTIYYMPPKDIYGIDIDKFTFTLNQTYSSERYTINLNVDHIYLPPTIVPLSYTKNGTVFPITKDLVETYVNSSTIITFNVTSPDHPWHMLSSSFGNGLTSAGVFCQYNKTIGNNCGDLLTMNSVVQRSEDGLWRVVFVPKIGRSGLRLTSLTVNALDPYNKTATERISISVLRINIQPVVNAQQLQYNTSATLPISINNLTVYDPDSTERNNITFTLTLTSSDGNDQLTQQSSISIPFANPYSCNITNTTVSCIDRNNILNRYLNTLSVNFPVQGKYQLVVYVNDLGYNAINPNEWRLSDTKTLEFTVGPLASGGGKKNNTVVISASVAAAAVAAAIIAVGVWRVMKARAPPTDAFFGDSPFSDGTVSSNPLYVENPNTSMNPLYVDPEN